MSFHSHYEEVELAELEFREGKLVHQCPCGDFFELSLEALANGADYAQCPTCSLTIKVLYTNEQRAALLNQHAYAGTASVAVVA